MQLTLEEKQILKDFIDNFDELNPLFKKLIEQCKDIPKGDIVFNGRD